MLRGYSKETEGYRAKVSLLSFCISIKTKISVGKIPDDAEKSCTSMQVFQQQDVNYGSFKSLQ